MKSLALWLNCVRQGRTGARVRSTGTLQAAEELVRETAGLLRMASASNTKAVAATVAASDVGKHAALERIRDAVELRVAQKE